MPIKFPLSRARATVSTVKFVNETALNAGEQGSLRLNLNASGNTRNITVASGTTLTLDASNAGFDSYIRLTNAAAVAITVAPGLPAGLVWHVRQTTSGGLGTVGTTGGITLSGLAKTNGQHTTLTVTHIGTNTVELQGGAA